MGFLTRCLFVTLTRSFHSAGPAVTNCESKQVGGGEVSVGERADFMLSSRLYVTSYNGKFIVIRSFMRSLKAETMARHWGTGELYSATRSKDYLSSIDCHLMRPSQNEVAVILI